MKAPDKIFIPQKRLDDNWNQQRCDDVIYIRKDALLAWAKEMENCSQISAPLLVHELIRKIESL